MNEHILPIKSVNKEILHCCMAFITTVQWTSQGLYLFLKLWNASSRQGQGINGMLADGQYPDMWKKAQVTPVPKIKQPSMYKHFRPISLLYHLGKLAEQALVNKLKAPLKDAIASNQYAYRPKVGSTDALLQLLDDCTAELDLIKSKYVQLACLDFSKAFDKL